MPTLRLHPQAALIGIFLAAIPPSNGQLLSDDFEGDTAVGAVETDNHDPGGWMVSETNARDVQVYNALSSDGLNSPSADANTAGNYLRLRGDFGAATQPALTTALDPIDTLNQSVRLSFRLWVVSSGATDRGIQVFAEGDASPQSGLRAGSIVDVRFHVNGSIKAVEDGSVVTIAGANSFPRDSWVQVHVDTDFSGTGYTLTVAAVPFDRPNRPTPSANNMSLASFGELVPQSAGSGYAFLDDVALTRDITTVNSISDSGPGSLRQAILDAPPGGTIHFDPALDGQIIVLGGSRLTIDSAATIDASSLTSGLTIDAAGGSRVLEISAGATAVTLRNLTLIGGAVPADLGSGRGGRGGGGINHTDGTLFLDSCKISGNRAGDELSGGTGSRDGGGIFSNGGDLHLVDCEISDNAAGDSLSGPLVTSSGGHGGGICRIWGNSSRFMHLTRCRIMRNRSGSGSPTTQGSHGGNGGGIFVRTIGASFNPELYLEACSIVDNSTGDGSDLHPIAVGQPALNPIARGGNGGNGGGICLLNPIGDTSLIMIACSVTGNRTGRGGDGIGGSSCSGGHAGNGGGITVDGSDGSIICATTVAANRTGRGGNGSKFTADGDVGATAGDGGNGGGIFCTPITNGIHNWQFLTIVGNSTGPTGASGPMIGPGTNGSGGGIYNASMVAGAIVVTGSILSPNSAAGSGPDVEGGFTDSFDSNLPLGTDSRLAPLGDYGGHTLSMPPLPDSPAISTLTADEGLIPDQRSLDSPDYIRIYRDADGDGITEIDLGAVEYDPATDLPRFWPLDFDRDGIPFGIEQALGTDPLVADSTDPRNLSAPSIGPGGETTVGFGFDQDVADHTVWILRRSLDLGPGGWIEVYRFDGPSSTATVQPGFTAAFDSVGDPTSVTVTAATPAPPEAFYHFEALLVP